MWVLEHDGDVLHGKKLWLRPGTKFLFGRTARKTTEEDAEQLFIVSDKTISRKHLTIEVNSTEPEDCGNLRTRSRLTLTDLETMIGTLVNEEQIKGRSQVLDRDVNVVQLGRFKHLFRFTWVPVVFTFSFTSKEKKARPYESLYDLLGPLDIKVLDEYRSQVTTHVVAKKRNTAKGLQALIEGKHIVHNDSFINAVIAASHAAVGGKSPLENDFGLNWPDEQQFLPPKGEEPTARRDEAYAPSQGRQDMFDGYTFVFYERKQFQNLLPPITTGRGKALFRDVIPETTTVDDFVRYVKSVAGEKGLGELEDGSVGRGVVVVRFNPVGGEGSEWYAEFGRKVALQLDQRLIEQNEFLDAILGQDGSVLRKPLDFISSSVAAPLPSTATSDVMSSQTVQSSQPVPVSTPIVEEMPPPETSRRGRSRRTARAQFRGFLDDDFSGPSVVHPLPEAMEVEPTRAPTEEPQSQGLFVSQDPETQREPSHPPETMNLLSRKRPISPVSEEEDVMEVMAPTTAAIKRRRLAEVLDRKRRGESTPPPPPIPVVKKEAPEPDEVKPPPKKTRRVKQASCDPIEEARIRREEAEALAQAEREAVEAQFEGMDIKEIRARLVIEEMEVKRVQPPPRVVAHADESERWEDKWNGRKNFKRFRRRGAEDSGRRIDKVIVALEEVKNRNYGIGDEFWDADESHVQKKKGKGRSTDKETSESRYSSQSQSRAAPEPSEPDADDNLPVKIQHQSGMTVESSGSDLEIVPKPKRATQASSSRGSQKSVDKLSESRNVSVEPASKKRGAAALPTVRVPPAKKLKPTIVKPAAAKQVSDDDSDDGLKFKFRKKTR